MYMACLKCSRASVCAVSVYVACQCMPCWALGPESLQPKDLYAQETALSGYALRPAGSTCYEASHHCSGLRVLLQVRVSWLSPTRRMAIHLAGECAGRDTGVVCACSMAAL
jgi:hypothetical protein